MPSGCPNQEAFFASLQRNMPLYKRLSVEWLSSLMRHRSVLDEEAGAVADTARILDEIGLKHERLRIPEDLPDDKFYTMTGSPKGDRQTGKENLVAFAPADEMRGGKSLILCSHLDVVDAEPGLGTPFAPRLVRDRAYGRGAADAKGPVTSVLLALKMLSDAGIRLQAPVEAHFVIEEEIGGNGALAVIRQRPRADGVVVSEPTSLNVHPAGRGALWFALVTKGVSTHMGRANEGVNAIEKAYVAIRLLRRYESRLLAQSRHYPQFERYKYPIQLNIGTMRGGVMPAMVPDLAIVEGGIGFLPNKTLAEIERELHRAIQDGGDEWLKNHYELRFNRLRNDAYAIPSDHPLPQALSQCCKARGKQGEIFGWNVSCDARLYAKVGKMPTVVFGPGNVAQAHASNEYVNISEVVKAAEILATFMISWCGSRPRMTRR